MIRNLTESLKVSLGNKNADNVLLEIKEFSISEILGKVTLFGWIFFCIYMYPINPLFFAVTGIFAGIILVKNKKTEFILTEKEIQVTNVFLIPIMNKTKTIPLNTIDSLEYEEGEYDKLAIILAILGLTGKIKASSYLTIKLKNGKIEEFITHGSSKEFHKLVEIAKPHINLEP